LLYLNQIKYLVKEFLCQLKKVAGDDFQNLVSSPKNHSKDEYLGRLDKVRAHWLDVLAIIQTAPLLKTETQEGPGWDRAEIQKYLERSKDEYEVAEQSFNREP